MIYIYYDIIFFNQEYIVIGSLYSYKKDIYKRDI